MRRGPEAQGLKLGEGRHRPRHDHQEQQCAKAGGTRTGRGEDLRGRQILADPRINKGTAFGDEPSGATRLTGLVAHAGHSRPWTSRSPGCTRQYQRQPDDLARNVLLNAGA